MPVAVPAFIFQLPAISGFRNAALSDGGVEDPNSEDVVIRQFSDFAVTMLANTAETFHHRESPPTDRITERLARRGHETRADVRQIGG